MQVELVQVIETLMTAHNIQTLRIAPPFEGLEKFDYGLRKTLDPQFDWPAFGDLLLQKIPASTLVFAEGTFELHFAFCRVPTEQDTLLCIGPWTTGPRSERARKWAEESLGPAANKAIGEYYDSVPRVVGHELLSSMNALISMLFPEGEFEVMSWYEFLPLNFRPDLRFFSEPSFEQDLPAALVEQRYEAENRLLDAVTLGDSRTALAALTKLSRFLPETRDHASLREQKNFALVANTLLRKAIEQATVHPFYIDRLNARYTLRIEGTAKSADLEQLTRDMVQEYCTYVQRYSLRRYSPLIQKVINHINLNLDSQFSLKSLAAMCFISPSYLSNLFKQETGQTLTDYINTRRIQRAAYRLRTTDDGVAAVAEQVGILDVNYFTKIFKKMQGVTPTQYRRQNRER